MNYFQLRDDVFYRGGQTDDSITRLIVARENPIAPIAATLMDAPAIAAMTSIMVRDCLTAFYS
jgi:hypothetical protein